MSGISIYPDNGPGRKLGPKEKKISDTIDLIIITVFMTAFLTLWFWAIIFWYFT